MNSLLKHIAALSQIAFESMASDDASLVIQKYTDEGIKILGADFGFMWGKFNGDNSRLIYKSPNSPSNPIIPNKKNITSTEKKVLFDSDVKKENYEKDSISQLKSYIILPIRYGDNVYGNVVLGYKKPRTFSKEEIALAEIIANAISHVVTVIWLIKNEQKALAMAEKQKEIEILLSQEKLRSEFLANATHEFRTPLAIIRGTADLALRTEPLKREKEMEKALHEINKEVENLSETLSDSVFLLAGSSRNHLRLAPINLLKFITEMANRLKTLLRIKKISFRIEGDSDLSILADSGYMEKLFTNLMRNAITYGKKGGKINVTVEQKNKKAVIQVKDTGIGIPKEELPYIFERFYRTTQAREMSTLGTGLGLSICKMVTEGHGGSIAVESTEGKGSTFTVTLPLLET